MTAGVVDNDTASACRLAVGRRLGAAVAAFDRLRAVQAEHGPRGRKLAAEIDDLRRLGAVARCGLAECRSCSPRRASAKRGA